MTINIISRGNNSTIFSSHSDTLYDSSSEVYSRLSSFFSPSTLPVDSGILPPGVLHISKNFLVFERPPCYQNISVIHSVVSGITETSEPVIYRILVPWQLYIVHFNDQFYTNAVQMHFMQGPLTDIDQQLYMAPILNLYTSGQLCRPMYDNADDVDRYSKNIAGVVQSAYDWIWNSGTNLDITETIAQYFLQIFNQSDSISFCSKEDISYELSSLVRSPTSFYTSAGVVDYFYRSWEKNVDMQNVNSFTWPKNSPNLQAHRNYQSLYYENLEQYCLSNDIPFTSSSECCDECTSYDEDNDEYYSSEDCECSCHEPHYAVNPGSIKFFKWLGLHNPPGLTFSQAFEKFFSSHSSYSSLTSYQYFNLLEDYFRYSST